MSRHAFATRSQAAEAAKRLDIANFRTAPHLTVRGQWRFLQTNGPAKGPDAKPWAATKDYVGWVETQHRMEGRMPGYDSVIIVTCMLDEIDPADLEYCKEQGWVIEPITPSLFARDPGTTRAPRNVNTTGERAKSDAESPVKIVWATADEMPNASRQEVVEACVAKGVNASTASTQYYKWKKSKNLK